MNPPATGKAHTERKTFSRETSVSIDVQSDKSIIWALLTHSHDYPRWNSTVISITGHIKLNEKIRLKSKLDPNREFKLTVKEFVPEEKLVWGDAMGKRVFTLRTIGNNLTNFSMSERIGGPIFPLIARLIPPFDQSFEAFAADLKREAESISTTR